MDFEDLLGPNPGVIDSRASNRWEAIDELVEALASRNKIGAEQKVSIIACIKAREFRMSTGIGVGIGVPHASTNLVSDLVVAIGRSRNGIQFDALDGKPVHLVLLFLVPEGQFQKHVNTLSNIAKLLHTRDFRDGLWDKFM